MERLARDQIAKAILRKFKFKVATLPAGAFQWLFFLSAHVSPPVTHLAFNLIAAKLLGLTPDEGAIARGEQAMPAVIGVLEGHLAKNKWMLGNDFSLVDCAHGPVLNVLEKARFSFADFPHVRTDLDTFRSRPSWQATPASRSSSCSQVL